MLEIELKQEERLRKRYKDRLQFLKREYCISRASNASALVRCLHRRIRPREHLREDYRAICRALDCNRYFERTRTPAEEAFLRQFAFDWKIKLYPQTWIGNLCVDYFTPALGAFRSNYERGYSLKGIAFEIDGEIHNTEAKMKKDQFKEKSLMDLGLMVWRFSDQSVYQGKTIPNRASMLLKFGKLSDKERKRIWSRIHLATILYHGDFGMVSYYFPMMETASSKGDML